MDKSATVPDRSTGWSVLLLITVQVDQCDSWLNYKLVNVLAGVYCVFIGQCLVWLRPCLYQATCKPQTASNIHLTLTKNMLQHTRHRRPHRHTHPPTYLPTHPPTYPHTLLQVSLFLSSEFPYDSVLPHSCDLYLVLWSVVPPFDNVLEAESYHYESWQTNLFTNPEKSNRILKFLVFRYPVYVGWWKSNVNVP